MSKWNWNLIGGIVGILSLVIAVIFYLLSVKEKDPCYAVAGMNLASSSISKYGDLEIRYANKIVPRITVTNICFANTGREPIRKTDIAAIDPLRLECNPNTRILSCKMVAAAFSGETG
jgi:hypothetical protein